MCESVCVCAVGGESLRVCVCLHSDLNTVPILKKEVLASLIALPVSEALSNTTCSCFRSLANATPGCGTNLTSMSSACFFLCVFLCSF